MPRTALPLLLVSLSLAAAEPPAQPWTDKASLSMVSLSGNAQGQTLGLSNEFKYTGPVSSFAFNAGAVRVSTTTIAYSAVGTSPTQYDVKETRTTVTTAESYLANGRYDHTIDTAFFAFGALGWDRNVPSGISSRTVTSAGMGYAWVKTEALRFRTDLGGGYTRIKPVFETPGFQDSFGTWNLTVDFARKAGAAGLVTSNLEVSTSMKDTSAYLAVWKNAFTTNLGKRLALKVGYDCTYNNAPAYLAVDILQAGAVPPVVLGKAPVRLRKLDTVLTTSLVISL
ncbi:DUF481 domain-containing protein [Mesoterricola silvestris]|uniref:DUF481 domain-containing protein n=1 Tax=Mesoterricola silvestris TaxID=2927979 RepID=A0AA48GKE8_9BACT|nr:DUF481 domain-containing protein [Mesoterricola silvestris]BDU72834.1 hypothetical protein METEAL_20080 [Mesoterricola silvestris]